MVFVLHGFLFPFKCNSCVGFIDVEVLFGYLRHLVLLLSVLLVFYWVMVHLNVMKEGKQVNMEF